MAVFSTGPDRRLGGRARVLRLRDERWLERDDRLAGEEPMEIRVAPAGGQIQRVAVTMRTPGSDFALAVGLLVTEGLVAPDDVDTVAYCTDVDEDQRYNAVVVALRGPLRGPVADRAHAISAACGVCGKTSLEQIRVRSEPLDSQVRVTDRTILAMPERLRDHQTGFDRTGSLHAAAAFSSDGRPASVFEDVGRHNAVDKVIGRAALDHQLPLRDVVLVVSGRLSFEIIQKAAVAGIGVVAAVSGPSDLAVRAADELGITAIGFVRDNGMNIYSHPQRIVRTPTSADAD